ncbi:prepilin-type N-terminal cleavage/methylation domain-containing protein [Enterococcus alcedinis]|uniref:Prepilin-type N-terminal cleavage/methylation domain-containing protein n=1 Tax=Enterococcus alcedinis TaxID=1274384 RepID=A0A917JGL3_9ENTE|nr:type II secretion system protein [Enterococcus alcedinis]MBP2101673.1 competence protein ComGD [Enterococcus alcedinis]GGI64934.1 hypothetical protein GCM10011482_05880 [Enterococcus alcedinis]
MKPKFAGFTLVESLLVLTLVSVIVTFSVVITKNLEQELAIRHFFTKLDKHILLNHQASFVEQDRVIMGRGEGSRTIHFIVGEQTFDLPVPEGLRVSNFPPMNFAIGTGDKGQMRSFFVDWDAKKIQVSYNFLFGKGHYEKEIRNKP